MCQERDFQSGSEALFSLGEVLSWPNPSQIWGSAFLCWIQMSGVGFLVNEGRKREIGTKKGKMGEKGRRQKGRKQAREK